MRDEPASLLTHFAIGSGKNTNSGTFEDDFLKNTSTFFLETKGIYEIRVVDFESGENRVA